MKKSLVFFLIVPLFLLVFRTEAQAQEPLNLHERVKGLILLQVENHGEAWYVHPSSLARYYMKDGETAYEMMRAFGLGISNADFARLERGEDSVKERLKGRIVLKVEERGEAFYIHPKDGSLHYLKNGAEAYRIMRELSLGITNKDLERIAKKEFTPLAAEEESDVEQAGEIPDQISLPELRLYWLSKINTLREERGLRMLVLDERFNETALEYAAYMSETGSTGHERENGESMHQWIDTKGLAFTKRYSEEGWKTNYFTENISWGRVKNSTASVQAKLDHTLRFYLSEEPYNGAHYRSIYHPDWNSFGMGIAFKEVENGEYQASIVFHYGSLAAAE